MSRRLFTPEERKLILPERWFPLPDRVRAHTEQLRTKQFLTEKQGHFHVAVIAAGRRSFKTERFLKRRFVLQSILASKENNLLAAPTRLQAKQIFWEDVKTLSPDYVLRDKNESELWIEYSSGTRLHIAGLDAYKRIQGIRWNRVGITEYQEVAPKFFATTLQPILNDTNGEGILEGRPIGKNHFFDDFKRSETDPERWGSFTWKSEDVMSREQIDAAKRELGLIDYLREYDASFEASAQKVYYGFGKDNYRRLPIDPSVAVIVTCDFNAQEKPMSWVVGQRVGDDVYWQKVLAYQYTNTHSMCTILDEWLSAQCGEQYPLLLRFYGDYSGTKHTSNSAWSDWEIIEEYFRNKTATELRIKPCLSVRDRCAATNARLCNAAGERRMFVDPEECRSLVCDWEYVEMKANGQELDDSNPDLTHASDAVDYYTDYEFPLAGRESYFQRTS